MALLGIMSLLKRVIPQYRTEKSFMTQQAYISHVLQVALKC